MRASRLPWSFILVVCIAAVLTAAPSPQAQTAKPKTPAAAPVDVRLDALKKDVAAEIDGMKDLTQQMVDSLFSFGELGFQEVETARYCADILRKNGFTVKENVAGMPTGWTARWGSG